MRLGLRGALCLGISAVVGMYASGGAPAEHAQDPGAGERAVLAAELGTSPHDAAASPASWCGSGETAENRLPQLDVVPSSTIRVMYAYPTDVPNRFGELAGAIVADVAALDNWWRLQDPKRELRWDLYAFPGCEAGIETLDLGALPLMRESEYYAGPTGYERLANEIAVHLAPTEKALAFYDGAGAVINELVCGLSKVAPRNGGRYGISVVSLRSGCGVDIGAGAATARIAVHELAHNLGAVPRDAPSRCGDPSLGGHTCDSPADLMFPYASSDMRLSDAVLDVDRNDYYGHSGDWWDVRDSAWLARLPRRALTVATSGPGAVSSSPAAVSCPSTCTVTLEDGFAVRLVAVATPSAEFYGWKGSCTGEGVCSLSMTRDMSATATFGPPRPSLAVRVAGKGRVTSTPAGIACPGRCAAKFPPGAAVVLRAEPASKWKLRRWSSACGTKSRCVLRLTGDRRVSATFVQAIK